MFMEKLVAQVNEKKEEEVADKQTVGSVEVSEKLENGGDDAMEIIIEKLKFTIEEEFGINISDYSIREQLQFVNFLSNNTNDDVEKVKEFLNHGNSHDSKRNRIKSVLSMELDRGIGEILLSIGEETKDQPEVADKLFAQYSVMVDAAEQAADEMIKMSEEVLVEKKLEKNEIINSFMSKGANLLKQAGVNLKTANNKSAVINQLIVDLQEQEKGKRRQLNDLMSVYANLKKAYLEFVIKLKQLENIGFKYLPVETSQMKSETRALQKLVREGLLNRADYHEKRRLLKEDLKSKLLDISKIDIQLINEEIALRDEEEIRMQRYVDFYSNDLVGVIDDEERLDNIKEGQLSHQELFGKDRDLLQAYKDYQKNFEQKLQEIIFNTEQVGLPDNFQNNIEKEIQDYQPELESGAKPYLPVGISSELPKENEIHAKPIDALAYMFWLKNQGAQAEFMVVDTIQETNYQAKHGLDANKAREQAGINGDRDKKWYEAVISAFNLSGNISMTSYQQVEQYSGTKDSYDLIEAAEKQSPIIAKALENLIQGSVESKSGEMDEEKKKLLGQYGKTEIAFILTKPETKISHKGEYRYDIIAKIIPIYNELKKRMDSIPELSVLNNQDQEQAIIDICLNLAYADDLKNDFSEYLKAIDLFAQLEEAQKKSEYAHLFNGNTEGQSKKAIKTIGKINAQKNNKQLKLLNNNVVDTLGLTDSLERTIIEWEKTAEKLSQEDWFKNLKLPKFHYPEGVTGMSFEMKTEKRGEVIGDKEFYSSGKGQSQAEVAIEENQVMATTSPMAAAKLLILSEKRQKEYLNKVIKPLLVNFYIATSANKQEAQDKAKKDLGEVKTVFEVIKLIQEKIVAPVEMQKSFIVSVD